MKIKYYVYLHLIDYIERTLNIVKSWEKIINKIYIAGITKIKSY